MYKRISFSTVAITLQTSHQLEESTEEIYAKMPLSGNVCSSRQAASYETGSKVQQGIGIKMINMLNIEKGATVLDLGCGTGYLTKVLSERVGPEGKVVAVDPDGERLKIAREEYSACNIEYIEADDKTFPPGQYDIIYSNTVIHWIGDKEALLKKVYQNLRPGGRFAFTTTNAGLPFPEIGKKVFNELVGPDFLDSILHGKAIHLDANEYKSLATDAGFKQASMTLVPIYPQWDNLDKYIDAVYGWFQGEFDPAEFDQEAYQEIKREYGPGPVTQSEPVQVIYGVCTKPVY